MIAGKTIDSWQEEYPLLKKIIATEEVFWLNPKYTLYETAMKDITITENDIQDAEERLQRFAPYLAKVFPNTEKNNGIIESPLIDIPRMTKRLEDMYLIDIPGRILLKCDHELPIAGSIKARGGIYEVLKHAEDLAIKNNMISIQDDYSVMATEEFRNFFSQYKIAVGSTGNLGLSIGIISAKLGFKVTVHMSADAKSWKKALLRSKGVNVIEYTSDYSEAVKNGRIQSSKERNSYFIDDENSINLFLGYAVAAFRLKKQLEDLNITVDDQHPLYVYLPCGVGGGPGGVAFGLKQVFKDNVHCFFAEPTHSPCMLIGMMTGLHDKVSVQDFGIDNITEADGLAVGRASGFVGKTLERMIRGVYTIEDRQLYILLKVLADEERINLEPSALAGMMGPVNLIREKAIKNEGLKEAVHIIWATGGSLVPKDVMDTYYNKGKIMIPSSL